MKQSRRRRRLQKRPVQPARSQSNFRIDPAAAGWPGERSRFLSIGGIVLIALCTIAIYTQTLHVPPINYEDYYYLTHSPYVSVSEPFSSLRAVWSEPYFANFHPVTTTTWLVDRTMASKNGPFDGVPFRLMQLLYASAGSALLILLYRRLGIPVILAVLGALVYAAHPIHTEVVAWLSARKDLMSLIFIELGFLAWLWARAALTANQWRLRHAIAILCVLLAVLSKPIAVILPALFVGYEFCSGPHAAITSWRWAMRRDQPVLSRTLALAMCFLITGGVCAVVFRDLLSRDAAHGGWLICVPIGVLLLMMAFAPSADELTAFAHGNAIGVRVLAPPLALAGMLFGAGSAWTFWAQGQVGAIKGGLTLVPTLNLSFDAMLAYAGKMLIPANLSASYAWNNYPYVSLKGALGLTLVVALLWAGARLAGSQDQNRRLIAFGIFWYLIAFVPVSNLVPTSTKMADRYLFVPGVGAILAFLALAAALFPAARRRQWAVCAALLAIAALYTYFAYTRTEVWCGKTTLWNGQADPDLSLWTSAADTDPENTVALSNLALVYLRMTPPQADQALQYLNRALEIGQANQENIAGGKQLDLAPIYQNLGDANLAKARSLGSAAPASDLWRQRKEAYAEAIKYFGLSSAALSGFAPSDARLLDQLANAYEGQAEMDARDSTSAALEQRAALLRERDELWGKSQQALNRAREILSTGNVSSSSPEYRAVLLDEGNIIFAREVNGTSEEKAGYYHQALARYQEAAALIPDDPRPFLYEGLCYERLTGIAQSAGEKQEDFTRGEAALRKALTLNVLSPDYSPALPYRALASLYAHVNDYRSALDSLKSALQADPAGADSANVSREIQSVEQYLAAQKTSH